MMFGGSQTARETSDLAFTDPLTGLGNMRRFFDKVDRLIAERADDPAPFTIGILTSTASSRSTISSASRRRRHPVPGRHRLSRRWTGGGLPVRRRRFAFVLPMVFSEEAASEKSKMLIESCRRLTILATATRGFPPPSAFRSFLRRGARDPVDEPRPHSTGPNALVAGRSRLWREIEEARNG